MLLSHAEDKFLSDKAWFALASQTPLGALIEVSDLEMSAEMRLSNLGFARLGQTTYRREARLDEVTPLVASQAPGFDAIDAVAIISVARAGQSQPYVFETLRNVLSHFPDGVQINVLLGDASADYVARPRLVEALGEAWAERVHVHVPEPQVAAFLAAHFDVFVRMAWNYSRALRSYRGTKHLLLLEDDVAFARHAPMWLSAQLKEKPIDALSLYNTMCQDLPGEMKRDVWDARLIQFPMRATDFAFSNAQAMVYRPAFADALGHFIGVRLNRRPADLLIDEFLRLERAHIAYAQPSMVQHMGQTSTGLGHFHTSRCFSPIYPVPS